ncbi:MAG: hypothetical protein ACI88H_001390 [Cocleimonas sp.]|jgi:hypothetical protein
MNKRKSSFDEHRAKQQKKRLGCLRSALTVLNNAKYTNVTLFAKDVAKVVYELEKQAASNSDDVKKISYTTLLRNKEYRPIIDAYFAGQGGSSTSSQKTAHSQAEYEALKIHCANLDSQNELYRSRLEHFQLSKEVKPIDVSDSGQEPMVEDIKLLVGMITNIISSVSDLFDTVPEDATNEEHPEAGLYSPMGLVVDWETLDRFMEIENECKSRK